MFKAIKVNVLLSSGFLMLAFLFMALYIYTALTVFHLLFLGSILILGYNIGSIIFTILKYYEKH
jgi:hypothetical protein